MIFLLALVLLFLTTTSCAHAQVPTCVDDSVTITQFAQNPEVATPTGIAVDKDGHVFVAESHTHFRPDDYDGPESDRIIVFDDSDNDGRADKRTIFHEGFTHIMDIKFHKDGSLYVATRMDVHRMTDTDGDLVHDTVEPVVIMKTTGTYPHNGISGLCFNADGSLNFGLGENLGHAYTLVGTDGTELKGGGEGGSTYHVQADGKQLRRVTTGWWNPYGMCVDPYGRIFGTDNDPGASPPCRLIQIHEGADYGYEYRYGRTGLHPLISWTGELPGNIPMIAGTGEAPCGIISTESTGLQSRYRNNLLVAAWADHRIERYEIDQPHNSGQVVAKRREFITGENDFRPVGLAIGPKGAVFVSDWVSASYQLHGLGRIWKISTTNASPVPKRKAIPIGSPKKLKEIASTSKDNALRLQALKQLLAKDGKSAAEWIDDRFPICMRAEATRYLTIDRNTEALLQAAESFDPVLRNAAITAMSRQTNAATFRKLFENPGASVLLAAKRSSRSNDYATSLLIPQALKSADPDTWTVAVKWIADARLEQFADDLKEALQRPSLTVRQFLMITAAQRRLAGGKPTDIPSPKQLAATALDSSQSTPVRSAALRLLQPEDNTVSTSDLLKLAESDNHDIEIEAVRLLAARTEKPAKTKLRSILSGKSVDTSLQLEAIAAVSADDAGIRIELLKLLQSDSSQIVHAALQSLTGAQLSELNSKQLTKLEEESSEFSSAIKRLSGEKFTRPGSKDTDAWLKLLANDGDPVAGERVFFHTKVGTCGRCHQHSGRGRSVGPGLSMISRRLPSGTKEAKRWLLETILQPSKDMAPQYTPWTVVTKAGKQLTGLPRRKGGSAEAYLGLDGKEFVVRKNEIDYHQESGTSIMPEGLLQNLTEQELCDLFAFLMQSRTEL